MLKELWHDVRYRIRALSRRAEVERELEAELEAHLAREADAYERQGLSRADARRQARIALGGFEDVRERTRDVRGTAFLESLAQDVSYAVRGLAAKPAFAAGVGLTLALGIGANAAMFDVMDRLLLRPPAYLQDVDRVHRVYLSQVYAGNEVVSPFTSIARYLDIKRETSSFSTVAAFTTAKSAIGDGAETRERQVTGASAAYFALFDAQPVLGRFFDERDDAPPTGSPVAVLAYPYWQAEFGGRADVLGHQLRIGRTSYTVIGVAPKGFSGLDSHVVPAIYVPFAAYVWDARPENHASDYHWQFLTIVVKRSPGVTVAAATADLSNAVERSWAAAGVSAADRAAAKPGGTLGPVLTDRGPKAAPVSKVAMWVTGVAAIVFLIACANVANLLLARATTRRREMAMRLALGVSQGRLTRQLFIESLTLALVGGLGALAVAEGGAGVIRTLFLPPDTDVSVLFDARTAGLILLTTITAACAIGMAPAMHARRTDLVQVLGGGGRHTDGRASRIRTWLLGTQVALSVVLLVGAGLFIRSLEQARGLHLGYDVDPIVVVTRKMRAAQIPTDAQIALERRLSDAAMALPGVVAATPAPTVPFWGYNGHRLSVDGIAMDDVSVLGSFTLQAGTTDYFRTMGTRILRGRGFLDTDGANTPRVVVVSQAMGQLLWPGRDPIGQCLRIHVGHVETDAPPCTTVVGVADDVRVQSLDEPHEYLYYLPLDQYPYPQGTLLVRVAGRAGDMAESIRLGLQPLMPGDGYVTAVPFQDMVTPVLRSWQLGATMFIVFGALALVVAAIGLYSVVAYGVAARKRDLAIRIALGATRTDVLRLVMGDGLKTVVVSLLAGSALAFVTATLAAPLLFHVSPVDPIVYTGVAGVLLLTAVLATWLPARSAGRVDPNHALRAD